jgi:hypothetical protein
MGYDIWMAVDTGGEQPATVEDVGGCTYNVSGMFTRALGFHLSDLRGRTGRDCIADLERAVSHMRHPDNRAEYQAMNPSNGWGDHDGAAAFLERLLAACRRHPLAVVTMWL